VCEEGIMNKKLFDDTVMAQVDLARFEAGTRRRVRRILTDVQNELIAEIIKKDPSVVRGTVWREKRLTALKKEVDVILKNGYKGVEQTTLSDLKDLSKFTAKSTQKIFNNAIGAEVFEIVNTQKQLTSIVKNTMIDGATIGEWYKTQAKNTSQKVNREVAKLIHESRAVQVGMAKGESLSEIVNRIRGTATRPGIVPIAKHHADTLVRTSMSQVNNAVKMETYRENADVIKGLEIVATLDVRTTEVCMDHDTRKYTLDGKPIGHSVDFLGGPPYHWNCRSTTVPITFSWAELAGKKSKISNKKLARLDDALSDSQRASMGGPVSSRMNYEEWLRTQPESIQIQALGKTKWKYWKEKGLSISDLVDQTGRALTIAELESKYGLLETAPAKSSIDGS
jgi:SPP1 gp7 family putative phage head morphogenesis protein